MKITENSMKTEESARTEWSKTTQSATVISSHHSGKCVSSTLAPETQTVAEVRVRKAEAHHQLPALPCELEWGDSVKREFCFKIFFFKVISTPNVGLKLTTPEIKSSISTN